MCAIRRTHRERDDVERSAAHHAEAPGSARISAGRFSCWWGRRPHARCRCKSGPRPGRRRLGRTVGKRGVDRVEGAGCVRLAVARVPARCRHQWTWSGCHGGPPSTQSINRVCPVGGTVEGRATAHGSGVARGGLRRHRDETNRVNATPCRCMRNGRSRPIPSEVRDMMPALPAEKMPEEMPEEMR
jgi:hypothetical protein